MALFPLLNFILGVIFIISSLLVSNEDIIKNLKGISNMAKFVKKPVEVEAFKLGYDVEPKWFIENDRVCNFMQEKCINGHISCDLKTLEGTMRANKGDYIIQGVKEKYIHVKQIYLK